MMKMMEDKSEMMSFDWDDEIEEKPQPKFELMPDGDYLFTVTGFERSMWNGSEKSKVPPCKQAEYELTFEFKNEKNEPCVQKLTLRLRLHTSVSFQIFNFFNGIGLHKSGDGMKKFPWEKAIGKTGIAKVSHYLNKNNGKTYNQIDEVYTKENAPTVFKNDPVAPEDTDIPF